MLELEPALERILREVPSPTSENLSLDAAKPWENVRLQGEDLRKGAVIGNRGDRLNPATLMLLAATGCSQVNVARRPRVGLMGTGSELIEPGDALIPGKIYESNRLG